jgi:hypothetical protein
MKKGIRTVN